MSTTGTADLVRLIDALIIGDADLVGELFAGDPLLDTPEMGLCTTQIDVAATTDRYHDLLAQRSSDRSVVNTIDTAQRSVAEVSIELDILDTPLTIALVGDLADNGFGAVRMYHHMAHYKGVHTPRPQLLDIPAKRPAQPAVIAEYFQNVHIAPDFDRVMALYIDDAHLVAPPGMRAQGRDQLEVIYGLFLETGGIALHHCTATDNGTSCAIEFACDRWGDHVYGALDSGVAVYDYADRKLHAARIYDDLNPPFRTG